MTRPRKHLPLSVKLQACLLLLGFEADDEIDWDHFPALGLRDFNPRLDDYVPAELDPRFLRPLGKNPHKAKTNGRKGEKRVTSYGSDVHAIAKMKRLEKESAAARARMLAKETGELRKPSSRFAHGRKLQGRGFEKRRVAP
jgi:hypothetical protein